MNAADLQLAPVRQRLHAAALADIPAAVRAALAQAGLEGAVRPGQRIAVTAGSRGIANIALVLRTVVERLRELGTEPFIVPAMGSHGGATAAGEGERLLDTFGVG